MLTSPAYVVHLPVFDGPLDLLLQLIEQAELDITKVSLAKITDQYLAHIRRLDQRHLEDLTAFLVLAARLLQIKSEALLPRPPVREPGEEDPGDALARQLMAYKKYKQVSELLAGRMEANLRTYVRIAAPPAADPKLDTTGITVEDLRQSMLDVLASTGLQPALNNVVIPPVVRIRDKIMKIIASLKKAGRTTFQKIVHGADSRMEIVVSFLALLELIKQRRISVEQPSLFGEIMLSRGEEWREDQEMDFDLEFEE